MATCDRCGRQESMPYNCRLCGGTFCGDHRLPENHNCPGLESWGDPGGVFNSGFDDSVNDRGNSGGVLSRVGLGTGAGGALGYFRGNVTYLFLALMWLTFLAEWVVLLTAGESLFNTLFVLRSTHVEYVWTWVTSIFSHNPAGIWHIFGNSIVIYFFGPVVERRVGSRNFAALFLVSGAVAGLGQVVLGLLLGNPTGVLGASGAAMAVLGVLTVLNPNLTVWLVIPPVPLPLWLITAGYVVLSAVGAFGNTSILGGNIAHAAHLAGIVIGLAYGVRVKRQGTSAPERLNVGRGGGGMGGGPGRF